MRSWHSFRRVAGECSESFARRRRCTRRRVVTWELAVTCWIVWFPCHGGMVDGWHVSSTDCRRVGIGWDSSLAAVPPLAAQATNYCNCSIGDDARQFGPRKWENSATVKKHRSFCDRCAVLANAAIATSGCSPATRAMRLRGEKCSGRLISQSLTLLWQNRQAGAG